MVDLTKQISAIVDFWTGRGWQVEVHPTKAANHAIMLARQAAEAGDKLVLAGGGDGTIGEIANGLTGSDTILAPLPMGTTNSLARELKLTLPHWRDGHRLDSVMNSLANGRIQNVDVGYNPTVGKNGRYWLLWCGVGVDSFLVHELEPRPQWSRRLGRVGYSLQGLVILPKYKPIRATVTVDHQTVRDEFLLVEITNCRLYAGLLPFSPHAQLDDGVFEVLLFKGSRVPQTFGYISTLLRRRPLPPDKVITLKGKTVVVETEMPIGCHTDGDQAGFTPLVSENRSRALRLLVPQAAPTDLFVSNGEPFT